MDTPLLCPGQANWSPDKIRDWPEVTRVSMSHEMTITSGSPADSLYTAFVQWGEGSDWLSDPPTFALVTSLIKMFRLRNTSSRAFWLCESSKRAIFGPHFSCRVKAPSLKKPVNGRRPGPLTLLRSYMALWRVNCAEYSWVEVLLGWNVWVGQLLGLNGGWGGGGGLATQHPIADCQGSFISRISRLPNYRSVLHKILSSIAQQFFMKRCAVLEKSEQQSRPNPNFWGTPTAGKLKLTGAENYSMCINSAAAAFWCQK
jgi:hypothetical protein